MTISIDSSIDTITTTIFGKDIVSGLTQAQANANSSLNLVTGAYANANAALAEANAFQSIINSSFSLTNSTTNLVTSAYARANVAEINQLTVFTSNGITVNTGTSLVAIGNNTILLSANQGNTTQQGIVQLNDTVTSTSITLGATANAVNTVWATAKAAFVTANAGGATLTDSVLSISTITAATANAVNTSWATAQAAFFRANSGIASETILTSNGITVNSNTAMVFLGSNLLGACNIIFLLSANTGNTTQPGIVQLSDSVLSTSVLLGATANAVNTVWATAQAAFAQANTGGMTNPFSGTLTVNNLTSNVGINTGIIVANTRLSLVGIDVGSGLASNWALTNSTTNLVTGAYNLANSNQNLVAASYNLSNTTSGRTNAAFALANTAVQRATDVITGVLTVSALTSTGGVNTGLLVANTTITATGNITGSNFVTTGVMNSKSVIINTVNVGGTYVLGANDSGTILCFNNTNPVNVNTSSVNTGTTQAGAGFSGFRVVLIQANTGMVSVVAGPNTTLLPRVTGNNAIVSQNASVSLVVWSSNTYLMDGAIAANPSVQYVDKTGDSISGTLTVNNFTSNTEIHTDDIGANGNIVCMLNATSQGYFAAQTTISIGGIGITQAGAQKLNTEINIVTVSGAGQNSVVLPLPPVGAVVQVINRGAQAVSVFPPSGHGIDNLGLNLRANCAPSGFRFFVLANSNHWYTTANGICTGP